VGVDFELVQTVEGSLFTVVRANGTTQLGADDLSVLMALADPETIDGLDDESGQAVRVTCRHQTSPVHHGLKDEWITIRAESAETARKNPPEIVEYRFPLTNLKFDEIPDGAWLVNGFRVTFEPVADYEEVVSTLQVRDRTAVTGLLTVCNPDRSTAEELATAFCELASFARGCRVQWLSLEAMADDASSISLWVGNAITGPFVPLPLIESAHFWSFLAELGGPYVDFRKTSARDARRLVGMLLNATAEDDFLELRGAKLAIAVDALTQRVLPGNPKTAFASRSAEGRFLSAVREQVRTLAPSFLPAGAEADVQEWIGQLAARVADLARPTFNETLLTVCERLGLSMAEEDIATFIKSRNSLVHLGRFVCQWDPVPDDWRFAQHGDEYFWMLRFVDRLVLRTLGYRGAFLDRCSRDGRAVAAEPEASL
jgi:hypothetical protein